MNTENISMESFTIPSYREIPDIGLYLEQVAKYINSRLEDFPDMNVTTSMISNYAKQKLISRVSKKTYTRDQIATLILIVLFKNIISIENIHHLLLDMQEKNVEMETFYEQFRTVMLSACKGNTEESDDILNAIAVALAKKMYVEKYFETLK